MISDILKEVAGFYNKKVVFNTELGVLTEETKTFLLKEEVIRDTRHIMTARIEEFDDRIEVIRIGVMSVDNDEFLELNPDRKKV